MNRSHEMTSQEVTLVSLKGTRPVVRDDGVFNFEPQKDSFEGLSVAKVSMNTALALIGGTPHLFYPYYKGMDVKLHNKKTPRKTMNPSIVAKIISNPQEMSKRIISTVDQTLPPSDIRGPSSEDDESFGLDDGPIMMPEIRPEEQAGVRGRSPDEKDYERPSVNMPPLPQTLEELEQTSYPKKMMIVSLYKKIDIDACPTQHAKLNAEIADIARRHGIDYGAADTIEGESSPSGDSAQESPAADVGE